MRYLFISLTFVVLAACQQQTDEGATPEPSVTPASSEETNMPETPGLASDGEGEMCGGIAGLTCSEGLYCEHPEGQCLSVADGAGVCTTQPEICTQEYMPVCGCDGVTYGNACMAAGAGASIAAQGECAPPDQE